MSRYQKKYSNPKEQAAFEVGVRAGMHDSEIIGTQMAALRAVATQRDKEELATLLKALKGIVACMSKPEKGKFYTLNLTEHFVSEYEAIVAKAEKYQQPRGKTPCQSPILKKP